MQGGWVLSPIVGPGAGTEPIGKRIIEMPVNPELVSLRDWRQTFVTYVPPGSLKRGEDLVTTGGNGRTQKCTICHGDDLRGVGPFPPISGRSAIYTFRQLYDFKAGTRNGDWSPLMKEVVAKLTLDDMSGGVFSISNLGGIGGTSFTPIVNAPEVAILGISRGRFRPIYDEETGEFTARQLLPLSLSYDHRVIDGADGIRFLRWVAEAFEQPFIMALHG